MKVKDEFVKGKNNIGYISDSFIREFGEDELISGTGRILNSQVFPRAMSDSEIISELKVQECTLGDVLATINSSIEGIKDGYSNIFYIKNHSRVVFVYWHGGGWYVDGWSRDFRWYEGPRVFSPATALASGVGTVGSETLNLGPKKDICECERCEKCGKLVPEKNVPITK